ncbi:phage major tail tube protein [Lysinibacillus telephonicus]|uniref:phage major tail tube protein n=1 Tax=Lysinibacillus telephonicus TaxID=1714840 RepID=UPI003B9DCDCA
MPEIMDKLTNFTAYRNGTEYLGVLNIELPEMTALTDELSGAGIAGKIDMPVIGHFDAAETTLEWGTLAKSSITLAAFETHSIDCYGSQQGYDSGTGRFRNQSVKVSLRVIPKTLSAGSFEPGAKTGTSNGLEVIYIKIEIDGERIYEIDKLNFICYINGKDYLEEVRKNLRL